MLFENLEGRSKRLDEDRRLIRHMFGYGVQASNGQRDQFSHRPVAPINAKGGALRTVGRIAPATGRADQTGRVNLAHNAPPEPSLVGTSNDCTHKFMTKNTAKAHVAVGNLEVGVTNASQMGTDQRLARQETRFRIVVGKTQGAIEEQCVHMSLC